MPKLRLLCPIYWAKVLDSDKAFGQILRELRLEKKLSQEGLALDAGMERNYVSLIELGKNSPSVRMLFKLCSALRTSPSVLISRVEKRMSE